MIGADPESVTSVMIVTLAILGVFAAMLYGEYRQ